MSDARLSNRLILEEERSRRLERQLQARTEELAALRLERDALQRKLEEASLTDPLTGLRNRRHFQRFHPHDIAFIDRCCGRSDSRLMYLRVDLTDLKAINGRFSQEAGDLALLETCRVLTGVVRKSDTLFRWGGDEFLVVARSTDRDSGGILAERIRKGISSLEIRIDSEHTTTVGCALGWSFYPFLPSAPRLLGWEQTLALAERALSLGEAAAESSWVGITGREPARRPELSESLVSDLQRLYREGAIDLSSNIMIDMLWMSSSHTGNLRRNRSGAA